MSISLKYLEGSWTRRASIAFSWVTLKQARHIAFGITSQGESLRTKMCCLMSLAWKVVIYVKHFKMIP